MTSPTRALWLLTAVAMALLIGGAAAAAAVSPAQIPAHLDATGAVTRWTTGSLAQWLATPATAAATVALVAWLSTILPRRPNLVNIPDKDRLLALPPGGRCWRSRAYRR